MHLKTLILGSTSVAAWVAATPLAAQSVSPAGDTPGQTSAATSASQSPDAGASSAEIVVTGIRRSLQSAQTIKRNSLQQIDTVVAQDIGKLPDIAVSDTAARIPGVEVERSGGEANRVLLRGLDNNYYTTTYNGREIFTAEARAVALQDFPAGGIAALEVFKTTTADLVEGGLAGEMNVRSRRPFDFQGAQIAGSAWGQYENRSSKYDPNGNLLLSDRWDTRLGQLGALINFSYTSLHYLDSSRSNTDFVATPTINGTGYRFPDIARLDYAVGHRRRSSINGSLQWKPSSQLEFYFDGLWQGFRNSVSDREESFPLYSVGPQTIYSNITTRPGTNMVDSLTVSGSNRPDGFQGATYGKTDTFQFAVGARYDGGPFKLNVDVARTRSKFTNSIYSLDSAFAGPVTINANPGGAFFTVAGFDASNPANFIFRGLFDRRQIARGDDYQGRIDATYDTGVPLLSQLQIGFRYVDRHGSYQEGSRYAPWESNRVPLASVPGLDLRVFRNGFPSDDPQGIRSYVTPTYSSIRDNIAQLRSFVGFAAGSPPLDPLLSFGARERSFAGYGQIKYELGSPGGIRVDGAVGLRVVGTRLQISGTSNIGSAGPNGTIFVPTPVDVRRTYADWLPNASARVRFGDALQLRLSATRTRTRPSFTQYNPGQTVQPPPSCGTDPNTGLPIQQNQTTCIRTAGGGDPQLQTMRSKNYDASLEYYFSRTGFVSAAVFQRDIKGFVQTAVNFENDPTYGLIQVTRPFNTSSGRIRGFEGQFNSFLELGFLPEWARSFGVQANVTYLDTNLKYPANGAPGLQVSREIEGVSKWTYNVDAFYEHAGLSARLSYNWRSSFLFEPFCCGPYREDPGFAYGSNPPAGVNNGGARLFVDRARPVSRLDFSASYDITKFLTLTADATNLLRRPLRVRETTYSLDGLAPATFPRVVRYEESVYSAGIRFRF